MADPEQHVRELLESLELTEDEELEKTPKYFTELLKKLFSSTQEEPPELSTIPKGTEDQLEPVVVTQIPFYSMCVHHLVPMFGSIDIAYEPDETILGFGSFRRAVDYAAHKPQLQERLVRDIETQLVDALAPKGLLVRATARQMCVELNSPGEGSSRFVSKTSVGSLSSGPLRQEMLTEFNRQTDS